jgi:Holliday junction resolvase
VSNPPRQKGTAGETELLRTLRSCGFEGFVRTPSSSNYDLDQPGHGPVIEVLATRPDRGDWLMTIDLTDFVSLLAWATSGYGEGPWAVHIESKRYKRFSLHSIFRSKFK